MQNTNITKFFGITAGILTAFVMFFVVVPEKTFAQLDDGGSGLPPCTGEIGEIEGVSCEWPEIPYPNIDPSPTTPPSTTSTTGDTQPEFGCSPFSWIGIQGCAAAIGYSILSFFAVFLGIAGILLNTAIALTVQSMDVYVNGAPNTTTSIELAWRLFRDLGNVVILFVLLFSSIGIILRTDVLVPRGTLAKIIIAAFLINFSLFFTKVIIDISNVFTFTIHQQIEEIGEQTSEDTIAIGVAGAFMKGLAPQRIIKDIDEALKTANGAQISMNIIQQSILGSVVILVATFVFLVMAAMLLVRFVILLLLLITSPIGVVGGLIPKLATYSKQWWSTLIGQAMFAPILMLFMLITVLVINSGGLTQAINDTNQLNPNNIPNVEGVVGTILIFASKFLPTAIQYFIIIALMVFGLIVAKSTAGKFGSGAVEWASKKAGSLAFGGAAWAGRQTLGRVGEGLASSARVGRLMESNNLLYRNLGKTFSLAGNQLKSGSMDFRATKAGGGLAKQLGAGEAGGKGGLVGVREARQKRITERAEKYAVNRGTAIQEAKVSDARHKFESAQTTYNTGPGTQAEREVMNKARGDFETAKATLAEMKGSSSKVRDEYVKATEQLTAVERKDADTHKKVIEAQEKLIEVMDERLKINPKDQEAEDKKKQLTQNLENYKQRFLSGNVSLQNYIDAQKRFDAMKKGAGDVVGQAKRAIGIEYTDATFRARRDAGGEFLKSKEKPEDSLLKAFKEMMSSGSGSAQTQTPAAPTSTTPPASVPTNDVPREGREL